MRLRALPEGGNSQEHTAGRPEIGYDPRKAQNKKHKSFAVTIVIAW